MSGRLGVLKNRAFLILWVNQILVQLSYNVLNFSLLILVFRLTGSNAIAALYVLMAQAPIILFGVVAGLVADRFDKRSILLFCDIGIGICMLLFIPVAHFVLLILAVAFILNMIFQFFIPTEAATVPSVVERGDLLAANALFQFTPMATLIVGSTIAGPVVANFGYNPVFIFGAASMLATFFIRRGLPLLPPEPHMAFNRHREDFSALIRQSRQQIATSMGYILKNTPVWSSIVVLSFIQAAFSTVAALGPGFMEQVLHIEATDSSIILLMPIGLGIALGGAFTVTYGKKFSHRSLITAGLLIGGLGLCAIAFVPFVGGVVAHREFLVTHLRPFFKAFTISSWTWILSVIVGFGAANVLVPAQTTLQENTKSDFRGRVFSVWAILSAIAVTVPTLVAGILADYLGVGVVIAAVGIVIILGGMISLVERNINR